MKRQKMRPANEEAEPPALSAGRPGAGGDEKAKESHGILGFLPSSWRHDWLLGFFLVVATLMAYQPVWHAGFIWDDDTFLTANPAIKSADGLYRLWFTASTPDYFPMTSSMLWLEWRLWANNPLGYHLVNVLLHGLSAVLLWRVLLRLNIPGALLAAALFALHPVNVESVAWITERKNTLSMFFYAGTLLCWLKFEDSGRGRWYGLALAAFALALLSKTAVALLPVVLLGIAWWRRGRVGWKDVRRVVPFFVMAAALCWVTAWFQYHLAIGLDVVRTDGFWSRLAGAGWAVWFYIYKAVLPLNLAFVYPRWQIDAGNVLSYLPLVLLVAAFVLSWRGRRGWGKALFFGLAYFVVMLLPVLGFLNIYFMRYSLVADHWEYFAIVGPIALAAAIIKKPVVAAALLLTLGTLTWKQCGMYTNLETLWQTTLRLNPKCGMAQYNLGSALLQAGRPEEAISHLQRALEIDPGNAQAHNNLGSAFLQQGRVDEAITHFQNALQVNPGYEDAHVNLGIALLQKGRMDEAINHFQKALQLKPADPDIQNNLALFLATCPQASLRNGNKAVELARQANELTGGENPIILRTLAAAFAEAGRFSEAVETAQRALHLAGAQSNTKLAGQLQYEMKLYQAGSPFHGPAQNTLPRLF
jgi:tetratricopeptide (TPR) repeat protein